MPNFDLDGFTKVYGPTLGLLMFLVFSARKWAVDWRKDGGKIKAQDASDNAQDASISAVDLLTTQMQRQGKEIEELLAAIKLVRRQNILLESICAKQGIDVLALYKQYGLE